MLWIQTPFSTNATGFYKYNTFSSHDYDKDYKYNIEVPEKDRQEISCNIRAKTIDRKKVYYTEKSKDYYGLWIFKCFEDEKSAENEWYVLNYLEKQ